MMDFLKENLLLGTDRRKLDSAAVPEFLQGILNDEMSDEEQLLSALTFGYFYERQGEIPVQIKLENKAEVIIEQQEEVSPEATQVLEEILSMDHLLKRDFLKQFIQLVSNKKLILAPNYVVEIIHEGTKLSKDDRTKIIDVIGKKGQYILQTFTMKEYQEILISSTDKDAHTSMFQAFSSATRQAQVSFLEQNWSQFSVHEKIRFTKSVCGNLTHNFYDFYCNVFNTEFRGTSSSKSLTRQLKRLIVNLLLRLNEPQLTQELTSRLSRYIESSGGFLSKILSGQKKTLRVPINGDDFWSGPGLNALMGLEEKNNNIAQFDYDSLFWLSNMLEITPLKVFVDLLEIGLDKTVYYLSNDEQFKTKIKGDDLSILKEALIDQALLSKEPELIKALASQFYAEKMDALVPFMDQPTFERFFLKHRNVTKLDVLASRESTIQNTWSVSFSKNMVSELLKICKSGKFYPNERFGIILARFFHQDAYDHLKRVSASFASERWFDSWRNHVVITIRRALKIRNALDKILS